MSQVPTLPSHAQAPSFQPGEMVRALEGSGLTVGSVWRVLSVSLLAGGPDRVTVQPVYACEGGGGDGETRWVPPAELMKRPPEFFVNAAGLEHWKGGHVNGVGLVSPAWPLPAPHELPAPARPRFQVGDFQVGDIVRCVHPAGARSAELFLVACGREGIVLGVDEGDRLTLEVVNGVHPLWLSGLAATLFERVAPRAQTVEEARRFELDPKWPSWNSDPKEPATLTAPLTYECALCTKVILAGVAHVCANGQVVTLGRPVRAMRSAGPLGASDAWEAEKAAIRAEQERIDAWDEDYDDHRPRIGFSVTSKG